MSAVSDYFQTALLIDDRVAADYRPLEPQQAGATEHLGDEPAPGLKRPREEAEDETPVHPSELVRAFLDDGVVCSVLEASEDSADAAGLVQQALRGSLVADLLLLDWLMYGDYSATIRAIDAVAVQHPERLTVMVVFTGAYSLGGVVQRLIDEAQFEAVDDFVVRRDNTIVLVFGKPGNGVRLTGDESQRQADNYSELPRMIRDDLELIYRGLMPEFAFSGINALRESAPRILATFSADLDAGALVHRALLPDADEAAVQFTRLLCSEMEIALRDAQISDIWDLGASPQAIAHVTGAGDATPLAERLRRSSKIADDLKALDDRSLAHGAIASGLAQIGLGDSAISEAAGDLVASMADAVTSSENLAVLLDSSSFGNTPPRLELGVVVRDEQGRYWLCIQPLCDSVRLRAVRAFPMMRINAGPKESALMIRSPEGEALAAGFDRRPHNLRLVEFEPADGAVLAEGDASGWHFTDVEGGTFAAITRLRQEFAAQALHELTSTASRVGTDGSEWLRRRAHS